MSIERVRSYFKQYGIEDRIMEFDTSSATVELAAIAVGTEPDRIAKTLSYKLKDDSVVLILASGMSRVDNKKYKEAFSCKAKMLEKDEVEVMIGHSIGGVCPFVINESIKVYLDESIRKYESVYPACGSSNSAIELTIEELEKYSNFTDWVDVCK